MASPRGEADFATVGAVNQYRARSRAAGPALLFVIVIALGAGTGGCTAAPGPAPDRPERRHTIPADICDRLDFSIFSVVWGDPLPTGVGAQRTNKSASCIQVFQGARAGTRPDRAGGSAKVDLLAFPSAAEAAGGYERVTPRATATPPPGGLEGRADRVRYTNDVGTATVEILDANIILTVTAGTMSPTPEPINALPSLVSKLAEQALTALRAGG